MRLLAVALVSIAISPVAGCGGGVSSDDSGSGTAGSAGSDGVGQDGSAGSGGAGGAGGIGVDASSDGSTGGGGPVALHHRPDDAQCHAPAAAGNCTCPGTCSDPPFSCTDDSQCADAGANGRCISPGGPAGCGCTFDACGGDGDCPSDELCACHGSLYTYQSGNRCVPGNCHVDADCGPGGWCSPSPDSTCGDAGYLCLGYYCHTSHDQCTNDSDCTGPANTCFYSTAHGAWECQFYAPPI